MIKLGDNKETHFFFDSYNMMLERASWADHHIGDALWRTSLALIASGNKTLIKSVLSCIYSFKGEYKFKRHPEIKNTDTSRDQSIMAMVSLKLHSYDNYSAVRDNLCYQISDKFNWSDAWFWVKERYLLWRIANFYKFFTVYFEPSYSKHLFCWMIWSSKQNMPLLRWLMKQVIPKQNYLCRALLGVRDKIPWSKIHPRADFIWQRNFPPHPVHHRNLDQYESEYNQLDMLVLKYVANSL